MATRKGSPRVRAVAADEQLRRGRTEQRPARTKPDVSAELAEAVRRVVRESQIFPGIPLS